MTEVERSKFTRTAPLSVPRPSRLLGSEAGAVIAAAAVVTVVTAGAAPAAAPAPALAAAPTPAPAPASAPAPAVAPAVASAAAVAAVAPAGPRRTAVVAGRRGTGPEVRDGPLSGTGVKGWGGKGCQVNSYANLG